MKMSLPNNKMKPPLKLCNGRKSLVYIDEKYVYKTYSLQNHADYHRELNVYKCLETLAIQTLFTKTGQMRVDDTTCYFNMFRRMHGDVKSIAEKLTDPDLFKIALCVSKQFLLLHRSGYVHGDVSPKNILYDENEYVLCDYESMVEVGSYTRITNPNYSTHGNKSSFTDDVFSLGATIYTLCAIREDLPNKHWYGGFGTISHTDGLELIKKRDCTIDTRSIKASPKLHGLLAMTICRNPCTTEDLINFITAIHPPLPIG